MRIYINGKLEISHRSSAYSNEKLSAENRSTRTEAGAIEVSVTKKVMAVSGQ